MPELKRFFYKYQNVFLLLISVLIFALENPFLSWFTFTPVLFLVRKLNFKSSLVYGGIYGVLCYTFYAPWLLKFSIASMVLVDILYFFLCAVLFLLLYFTLKLKNRYRPLVILFVLIFYEFIKTKGFAGFGYGLTGYTQWKNLYIIQISDIAGVFAVCALMDFCSVVVYEALSAAFAGKFSARELVYIIIFQIIFVLNIVYGFVRVSMIQARDEKLEKVKVALIQHNPDTSKTDFASYEDWVKTLTEISFRALNEKSENPESPENKISLVVWPETAVIPSIRKNLGEGAGQERKILVTELLGFIKNQNASFLIGNFDKDGDKDYNAAFFFEAEAADFFSTAKFYRKIHLVPFSECLPFGIKFPQYSAYAEKKNNMLWEKGTERTVFCLKDSGLKFASPICFEDTFGLDCRRFYKAGARAFISIGNDAWSKSRRCQKQHLKMAVFRSVENHVPTARCFSSGETCIISSTGKIVKRAGAFEETYLTGEIPVLP